MELKALTEEVFVAAQPTIADLADLKEKGIKTLIINRPDNETPGQPSFADLAAAARAAGITAHFLPVTSASLTADNAKSFRQILADAPKPVLATCRSGTRSATLWAMSEVGSRPMAEIVSRAAAAGYDVSGAVARQQSSPE